MFGLIKQSYYTMNLVKIHSKGFSPKTGSFISCVETNYDGDGIGTRKVGNVPVQTEKADQLLEDLNSGARTFEFGAQNRATGAHEGSISAKVAVTVA